MAPKRSASGTRTNNGGGPASKKSRASGGVGVAIHIGGSRGGGLASIKADPDGNNSGSGNNTNSLDLEKLKNDFIQVFSEPEFRGGITNSTLKGKFGGKYPQLVPIINELARESRLNFSKVGDEMYYSLVSETVASKFIGLDVSARMVYQVIEEAGNMGIWTKDVRMKTNIQQQALNKIFKALEGRQLIKPVKSVTAKAKKLYMLYDLQPAKELTGGAWYTELEFDHEFVSELRTFLMHCVRRLNGGKGVTLAEIKGKMDLANVSRVKLSLDEVQQLMQTLAFDYQIEQNSVNESGEALFIAARRVTSMCDFKWWDALSPDFQYRTIKFEDGVTLSAHEPHHHTS